MPNTSRRTFLTASAALSVSAPIASQSRLLSNSADELRIALVGCGGRGRGAAVQALSTEGPVRLVAMADAFDNNLNEALTTITKFQPDRVDVPEERRFTGFDAFQKAMDCDVDVVILATPPGFRPQHFEYAVEKGIHVFMEKPVAVDGPGVRKVLKAAAASRSAGLKVGVGLQRHHDAKYQDLIGRIHQGEAGDINYLRCYWNSSGVWVNGRQPEWSEMTYQMRNWYYFNWLCGEHITEQHIHNLDVCNWAMNAYPASAQGQGGRQVRNGLDHGEIYDHHMVEYTYANGATMLSQCRHIPGTKSEVNEYAHGSLGTVNFGRGSIEFKDGNGYRYRGENSDPYQVEHDRLFAAIRNNTEHHEAEFGAYSTLTSILGRMATYSGKLVTWEQALQSEVDLSPAEYSWESPPPVLPDAQGRYPIATPGVTQPF